MKHGTADLYEEKSEQSSGKRPRVLIHQLPEEVLKLPKFFNGEIPEEFKPLMEENNPVALFQIIETLVKENAQSDSSYFQCMWLTIVFYHPDLQIDAIQALNDSLLLNRAELLTVAVIWRNADYLEYLTTNYQRIGLLQSLLTDDNGVLAYIIQFGRLNFLLELEKIVSNFFFSLPAKLRSEYLLMAAEYNQVAILQDFIAKCLSKEQLLSLIKHTEYGDSYEPYILAASYGHLDFMMALERLAPELVSDMRHAENGGPLYCAVFYWKPDTVKYLNRVLSAEERLETLKLDNYRLYSACIAARCIQGLDYLETLAQEVGTHKDLVNMHKKLTVPVLQKTLKIKKNRIPMMHYLLSRLPLIIHAEKHPKRYAQYLDPLVDKKLKALLNNPQDKPSPLYLLMMLHNLIRRDKTEHNPGIEFLLDLPEVRSIISDEEFGTPVLALAANATVSFAAEKIKSIQVSKKQEIEEKIESSNAFGSSSHVIEPDFQEPDFQEPDFQGPEFQEPGFQEPPEQKLACLEPDRFFQNKGASAEYQSINNSKSKRRPREPDSTEELPVKFQMLNISS